MHQNSPWVLYNSFAGNATVKFTATFFDKTKQFIRRAAACLPPFLTVFVDTSKKRKTRRFLRNTFSRLLSLQRRQTSRAALRLNCKFVAEHLEITPSATDL